MWRYSYPDLYNFTLKFVRTRTLTRTLLLTDGMSVGSRPGQCQAHQLHKHLQADQAGWGVVEEIDPTHSLCIYDIISLKSGLVVITLRCYFCVVFFYAHAPTDSHRCTHAHTCARTRQHAVVTFTLESTSDAADPNHWLDTDTVITFTPTGNHHLLPRYARMHWYAIYFSMCARQRNVCLTTQYDKSIYASWS